jgi:hypothetical protein
MLVLLSGVGDAHGKEVEKVGSAAREGGYLQTIA